jgi:putative ABC transport system permease protein
VAVLESHPERGLMSVTAANFWDWSPRVPSLAHVVGLGSLETSLVVRGAAVRVVGTKVTEPFFAVTGVAPALGRAFSEADFRGDGQVVIVSHGLRERSFGRAAGVLGTSVLLDGRPHTVVGVMPATFRPIGHSDVWVPWIMTATERAERRFHMVGVLARLQRGRTAAEAGRDLQAEYRALAAAHPTTTANWTGRVIPLRELLLGDSGRALTVLGSAVAAVLVVAAVNVVGLLLAWLTQRRQELLVRLALGATVGRIVRQLIVEALLWGSGGLIAGLALAAGFVRLFGAVGLSPALEYDFEPRIDVRVVVTMALFVGAMAALTAMVPAWLAARRARDLVPRRSAAADRWGQRAGIALQVAASLLLVCTAATLLSGFRRVADAAGARRSETLAVDLALTESRYADDESQGRFFARLLQALSTRPAITRAGAASYVPPSRIYGNVRFAIDGRDGPTETQTTLVSAVDPDALAMLGIAVQRGRGIEARDDDGAPHVGVISATLARHYWPNEDPIGRRITPVGADSALTIVGIVDDVRLPLSADPRAQSLLYVPYRQVPWPFMTVLIAPAGEPASAIAALREEIARIDPVQAAGQVRAVQEIQQEWMTQPRLRSRIVAVFGAAALLLTAIGLWARVSYGVASRTRELAIRQALGARRLDIVRATAGDALLVVAAGTAVGLACLRAIALAAQAVIAGLPPQDPVTVVLAVVAFVLLAVVSAAAPAARAGRVLASDALRAE